MTWPPIDPSQADAWFPVAIKQLEPRSDYVIEDEWRRELVALSKFNQVENEHIIRGIAACKQSGQYYIVLEWADGGNLSTFWNRDPCPALNDRTIRELLYQLYGLADALNQMHSDADAHEVLSRATSFDGGNETSTYREDIQR